MREVVTAKARAREPAGAEPTAGSSVDFVADLGAEDNYWEVYWPDGLR